MIKKISLGLILLTIIVVNVLRFCWLDNVPYGFNTDELAGSVSIQCLETQGTDAFQNPHPVFFEQHFGTPKPPIYAYPAALWEKIFGTTTDRLRAFTVFANIWTIIGLFFLGQMMFGTSYGLLVALIASLSPWVWGLSRIAYESTFCATFLVWGIFFFLRSGRCLDKIAAAFFLGLAIYAYPPARLQIPMALATLLFFDCHRQKKFNNTFFAFLTSLIIFCIPLIYYSSFGNLQKRFGEISIFNPVYLQSIGKTSSFTDLAGIFINNYISHFSAQYLFVTGDPSWEHSTQHFGLLGWVDILGLAALVFFSIFKFKDVAANKWWLTFLAVNVLLDIIPVSLTEGGIPNALRTIGAFPFVCLLNGYGLWLLCERWRWFFPLTLALSVIFAFFFLRTYFTAYPNESKGWFCYWAKEEALKARTDRDWLTFLARYTNQDYESRYYLMNYHHESCSSSLTIWNNMKELLQHARSNN